MCSTCGMISFGSFLWWYIWGFIRIYTWWNSQRQAKCQPIKIVPQLEPASLLYTTLGSFFYCFLPVSMPFSIDWILSSLFYFCFVCKQNFLGDIIGSMIQMKGKVNGWIWFLFPRIDDDEVNNDSKPGWHTI